MKHKISFDEMTKKELIDVIQNLEESVGECVIHAAANSVLEASVDEKFYKWKHNGEITSIKDVISDQKLFKEYANKDKRMMRILYGEKL